MRLSGVLEDWEKPKQVVHVLPQAVPGAWLMVGAKRFLAPALAATGETMSVGPTSLRCPKLLSAIIASKARSALPLAIPECRDGGLHKISDISSRSGLAGVRYLFIPLFRCLMFNKKPTLRARAPGWGPKATSCHRCNSTLSSSLLFCPQWIYRHFWTESTSSSQSTQFNWDEG